MAAAWKMSKYGVFSGLYFPALGPEITPYLGTSHTVEVEIKSNGTIITSNNIHTLTDDKLSKDS